MDVAKCCQSVVSTNGHTSTIAVSEQTTTATSPKTSMSTITFIAVGTGAGLLLVMLLAAAIKGRCRRKMTLIAKDAKQQPLSSHQKSATGQHGSNLFTNSYGTYRRLSDLVPLSINATMLDSAEMPSITARSSTTSVVPFNSIAEPTTFIP